MGATAFYLLMLQKHKNSEQRLWDKKYPMCLGNISGSFLANNLKKTGLNECVYDFFID